MKMASQFTFEDSQSMSQGGGDVEAASSQKNKRVSVNFITECRPSWTHTNSCSLHVISACTTRNVFYTIDYYRLSLTEDCIHIH